MITKDDFAGYHSEWNLGSPGGWDYQRMTEEIGKAVWERHIKPHAGDVALDFDHPLLYPVNGFADMLTSAHRDKAGTNPGLIAVVAEEETLEDVVENRNLAERLDAVDGISGALMAPHWLELKHGRVCYRGEPVSVIFMDFNTDVLLDLHRKHGLAPLLQAVAEGRVINPRGTEPINVKSMFELITDPERNSVFHPETIRRTPWTRRFFERSTDGPDGEHIADLPEWTRKNWERLVLKPERGYSGKGVSVGGVHDAVEAIIETALKGEEHGPYIVQDKVPLALWSETIPELDTEGRSLIETEYQTDFRCLFSKGVLFGFLCRYGDVPTNVGSGGGVQPLAVLRSEMSVKEATERINRAIMDTGFEKVAAAIDEQKEMALERQFTYLLGPIKIALRPRIITEGQCGALARYCAAVWDDCLTLEKMWYAGELEDLVSCIEPEELKIIRSQPWRGSPAIFAADGLFGFGAQKEEEEG